MEKERMIILNQKAKEHYNAHLLKRRGMNPLKRWLDLIDQDRKIVDYLRIRNLKKNALKKWAGRLVSLQQEREQRANVFLQKRLKVEYWNRYFCVLRSKREDLSSAKSIWDTKSLKISILQWKESRNSRLLEHLQEEKRKNAIADQFACKCVPRRCIQRWRDFVVEEKNLRWKEHRKQMLRESVKVRDTAACFYIVGSLD